MTTAAVPWLSAPLTHDRAQLINGWDQTRISQTQVVILTTSPTVSWQVFWLFAGAQAMGFRCFLLHLPACHVEDREKHLSSTWAPPDLAAECAFSQPAPELLQDEFSVAMSLSSYHPAFIIAAEPDTSTVDATIAVADALDRHALIPAANESHLALGIFPPPNAFRDGLEPLQRLDPPAHDHPVTSLLLAAIILEAIRQAVLPLPDETKMEQPLFTCLHTRQFSPHITEPVVLVGAGGIGAPAAILLSMFAPRLIIYDHDIAEPSNRARAPWLVPDQPKVNSVAEFARFIINRMDANSRQPQIEPRQEKVTDEGFLDSVSSPVILMCAADNWTARAILSDATVRRFRNGLPTLLVNVGCSPLGASVTRIGGFHNESFACLRHRHTRIPELVANEQAQPCSQLPAASVLYTNWAAAALAVISLLDPSMLSDLEYNCRNPSRIYLRPDIRRCDCFHQPSA